MERYGDSAHKLTVSSQYLPPIYLPGCVMLCVPIVDLPFATDSYSAVRVVTYGRSIRCPNEVRGSRDSFARQVPPFPPPANFWNEVATSTAPLAAAQLRWASLQGFSHPGFSERGPGTSCTAPAQLA